MVKWRIGQHISSTRLEMCWKVAIASFRNCNLPSVPQVSFASYYKGRTRRLKTLKT